MFSFSDVKDGVKAGYKYLKQEWPTLRKAPFLFAVIFVAGLAVGGIAVYEWKQSKINTLKQRHKDKIDILEQRYEGQIEVLKQGLTNCNAQVIDYQQRLHLTQPSETVYSKRSNEELKRDSLGLASKIRVLLKRIDEESHKIMEAQMRAPMTANTEEEKRENWLRYSQQIPQIFLQGISDYNRQFKVDAILLRNEIQSRLPERPEKEQQSPFLDYEYPVNSIGIEMVATDLERLAKSLP